MSRFILGTKYKKGITVQLECDFDNDFKFCNMQYHVDDEHHYLSDEDIHDMYVKEVEDLEYIETPVELHDSVKPRFVTDVEIPFSQLKGRMSPITDDGLILKEVLKEGVGLPIPEKSIVYIHSDAFLEGQKEAIDSTRLRKKPFKFLFGDGALLTGLEIGIQTMKKGEISRIMVSPEYAFREVGPTQIPPNADILFEVEILRFISGTDIEEFEESKNASFEEIVGVYQCDNQLACNLFHQKRFKQAISRYRRLADLLEDVSVANEEEDDKRKEYLLKLYLNLAQCYLNVQDLKRAIMFADFALKIDSNNPKGLYRMGKALSLTGSYERAEHYLCEAKKHNPFEKCVNEAIKELEKKRKSHLDWERMFCEQMLRSKDENQKPFQFQEPPEFVDSIDREISKFLDSDEQELHFKPTCNESQLDVEKKHKSHLDSERMFCKQMPQEPSELVELTDSQINKFVERIKLSPYIQGNPVRCCRGV